MVNMVCRWGNYHRHFNIGQGLTRQIHSDIKKRSSFLALLFDAGDLRRYVFGNGG